MSFSAIVAFLKALPEMVGLLKSISINIKELKNAKTDADLYATKEQLSAITKQLENMPSRDELVSIVRNLNRL